MHSNNKPLSDANLLALEAERDIAADLLTAIAQMKAGQGKVVFAPAIEACKNMGMS
jgi:putative transcriptional regulator